MTTTASQALDAAERANLVVVPWPDGTMSVFGDQGSDEALMRTVLSHRVEIAALLRARATLRVKDEVTASR